MVKLTDLVNEISVGVNVHYFYKKANKNKNKFFKMLSDFRKKHSDTKWINMLDYALEDFNENPKKYKTIDDKQNILFKNLQNNKKVNEAMNRQQADELRKQLGGNKFIAMTGAKQFSFGKQGLGFRIGKNSKSINYVRIDLKSNDLYDMEFIRIRGTKITVVKKVTGVYNDQLQKIFTKHTGLYTRL